jgi:Ser/Thr protein kinase RdoA (MazF antagonist)
MVRVAGDGADRVSPLTDDGSMTAERVCAAFGLEAGSGASIRAVSRGAAGRIWRLDLGAERYAVKELFGESDEELVRREVAVTAYLQAAGIRLPGSLPGSDGRFLVPLTADAGAGWLRLYQWIDGRPADLADPRLAAGIGDVLGRLHAHALPPEGAADPWYETVPDPVTWDQLADAATARGAGWGHALAGHAGLLRDLADLVTPVAADRLVMCHRDLHPGNVLIDGSGDLVLLDWDDAGSACPDRELAGLLVFWHVSDDGQADDAAVERTLAAYHAAGGPGRLRDERSFGMYIAGRLNFLHGQASKALDPRTTAGHRDYASSEISDTLARLPALGLVSHLVSLAAAVLS